MIKAVLKEHPDNLLAQQLLQQIHTCVDTMHEVARPFGADLSELPTLKTQRVPVRHDNHSEDEQDDCFDDEGLSPYHEQLKDAYGKLHESELEAALAIFQQILEESPDDANAREGFRITYAAIVKENESNERHKKIEVISRTIHFLESMKVVVNGKKSIENR